MSITLDDKYTAENGRVFLTGTQALVRLPMTQMRRDRAAGLNTGAFISGYRGSPLGNYDQQLTAARKHLEQQDIVFRPGLNEDLAATAVWGSQQLHLSPGAKKDGLLGIWYGKGPGVDRSGDAFKHANAAGTSRHGGVLALAGDDHTCKSSSIPHQSDHAFMSALMPMLYPSSVHEFLEMGLLGVAMSRFSGCWVGYKVISETVETTTVVDLAQEARQFVIPNDFELPSGGLNLRWPDLPLVQDERLQEFKGFAALAFARANGVDQVTISNDNARFGIVASGKAYEDVRQALAELGIGPEEQKAIGLRLYKVRMPWPLEPYGIRAFSEGLEEVLVVEERREIIENQIKQQLFNWRADVRPRIIGKFDEKDRPFLSLSQGLTVARVAEALADRILRLEIPEGLRAYIKGRAEALKAAEAKGRDVAPPVTRLPHFCAGCPHNTSTRVPEGSKAMAGIGCHFMAQWMDRRTDTFTHMGAEGVPWSAISHFTDEKHRFVNLGDGTYFHSGHLAVRQSVAAKSNITYKILYNDAVAMTGGQSVDGTLTPQQITHQMYHEGVTRIVLMSDKPEVYSPADLAPDTEIRHRDEIDAVMLELREEIGTTIIVFEQTCAAEKRRRRKRGKMEDPAMRLWINPAVCEGCGDCSEKSNCIAIEPKETEMGRKRRINQSMCNKDYSCLKGFCPSFVTIRGGELRKPKAKDDIDVGDLPEPTLPAIDRAWNLSIAGVGGTGVLTIGAILGMAAHIEGRTPMILDMAGLAQKGGAVLSHVRIGRADRPVAAPRIAAGSADLLLGADSVVAASKESLLLCNPSRTQAILNAKITPVSDFVRHRDFDFQEPEVERLVTKNVQNRDHFIDFSGLATQLTGDEIGANMMMLGYAWQKGLVPIGRDAITKAIDLNGVSVSANNAAFDWGRMLAHDREAVLANLVPVKVNQVAEPDMTVNEIIANRAAHLVKYQDARLSKRYLERLERLSKVVDESTLRNAAISYAHTLAYKDEYEVARLYSAPEFREALGDEFEGRYKISFNLAPPILSKNNKGGGTSKREFGSWVLPLFAVLARMKGLRGSWADPFGYSRDRKIERRMIAAFEEDLDLVERQHGDKTPTHLELLSLPQKVRGYGPVKEMAFEKMMLKRAALREAIRKEG